MLSYLYDSSFFEIIYYLYMCGLQLLCIDTRNIEASKKLKCRKDTEKDENMKKI